MRRFGVYLRAEKHVSCRVVKLLCLPRQGGFFSIFLESQYPRSGFISGGTTFVPELETNDLAVDDLLPEETTAEVELLSSVCSLKADYFETTTGTRAVSDSFKSLLEQRRTGVQFIPASVSYHDGRRVDGIYWIAHHRNLNLHASEVEDFNK